MLSAKRWGLPVLKLIHPTKALLEVGSAASFPCILSKPVTRAGTDRWLGGRPFEVCPTPLFNGLGSVSQNLEILIAITVWIYVKYRSQTTAPLSEKELYKYNLRWFVANSHPLVLWVACTLTPWLSFSWYSVVMGGEIKQCQFLWDNIKASLCCHGTKFEPYL